MLRPSKVRAGGEAGSTLGPAPSLSAPPPPAEVPPPPPRASRRAALAPRPRPRPGPRPQPRPGPAPPRPRRASAESRLALAPSTLPGPAPRPRPRPRPAPALRLSPGLPVLPRRCVVLRSEFLAVGGLGSAVSCLGHLPPKFGALPGESRRLQPVGQSSPQWSPGHRPRPPCYGGGARSDPPLVAPRATRGSHPGVLLPSRMTVAWPGSCAAPAKPLVGQHLQSPPALHCSPAFCSQEASRNPFSGLPCRRPLANRRCRGLMSCSLM